jgi:hypothetical protein
MAQRAQDRPAERSNALRRLFLDHPNSLGMGWAKHGAGAAKVGLELIWAGVAALVHALVPGLFTDTASRIVTRIYEHIQRTRSPDERG